MDRRVLLTIAVAVMMVSVLVPFVADDESDGLTQDVGMHFDQNNIVLYSDADANPRSITINIVGITIPADAAVTWTVNDLGDTADIVTVAGNGSSASITAVSPGTVEVVATYGTNVAAAVVVIMNSPGTHATTYNFYVKVDLDAIYACNLDPEQFNIPDSVYDGVWINATQPTGTADADYNAWVAFKQACSAKGWIINGGDTGWIQDFFGLGTYQSGNNWIYWTQYHAENGAWVFNNTTMGYMDTQDSCNLGVYFRLSESPTIVPNFPGLPA